MTTLKHMADTGNVDGFHVIAWGLNNSGYEEELRAYNQRAANITELEVEVMKADRKYNAALSSLKEQFKADEEKFKKEMKKWRAAAAEYSKAFRAFTRKKGPNPHPFTTPEPVKPVLVKPEYDDHDAKRLHEMKEQHKRRGKPQKCFDGGTHIKRLAALAPDSLCTFDAALMIVTVKTPAPTRGVYRFFVGKAIPEAEHVESWKPTRFMAQTLRDDLRFEYGAAQSDGSRVWRTDGHRYIYTSAAPPEGKYDVGKSRAEDLIDIPNPDKCISSQTSCAAPVATFTVTAKDFLKTVTNVAAHSQEQSVEIIADSSTVVIKARTDVAYEGAEAPLFVSQQSLLTEEPQEPFLYNSDYLIQVLRGYSANAELEVVLFRNHGMDAGSIFIESGAGTPEEPVEAAFLMSLVYGRKK